MSNVKVKGCAVIFSGFLFSHLPYTKTVITSNSRVEAIIIIITLYNLRGSFWYISHEPVHSPTA